MGENDLLEVIAEQKIRALEDLRRIEKRKAAILEEMEMTLNVAERGVKMAKDEYETTYNDLMFLRGFRGVVGAKRMACLVLVLVVLSKQMPEWLIAFGFALLLISAVYHYA